MVVRIFVVTLLFACFSLCQGRFAMNVIAGKFADREEQILPFMASMKIYQNNKYIFLCSGSIISNLHILTAAHCYYSLFGKDQANADDLEQRSKALGFLRVNVGAHIIGKTKIDGAYHEIEQIFLRKRIDYKNYDDIMIIKLKTPIAFLPKTAIPIRLAKDVVPKPGEKFHVAGFGNHTNDGNEFDLPSTYTFNGIEIKDNDWCNLRNEREFCAGGDDQGTLCGDSGGPLYKNDKPRYQAGIVARGNTDRSELDDKTLLTDHGVYTSVAAYCEYIEEVTEKAAKCENVL